LFRMCCFADRDVMSRSRCQLHRGEHFELTSAQFTVERDYGSIVQQVRDADVAVSVCCGRRNSDTSDSSGPIPVPRPALG
jgi:hypothetical protein